jgi:streptogramin lyase
MVVIAACLAFGATPARAAVGDVTELPVVINGPGAIAAGPDGNFWLTEGSGVIGRLTPGGSLTEFDQGITGSVIQDIAAGPDGNLWFTESESIANKIGRITPTGTVTEFSVPTANSRPWEIAAGPDGNLWFTENNADKVARITPAGTITEFSAGITPGASPHGIAAGPDGNLWFTEASKDKVGRITPAGTVTEFSSGISASASPLKIAAGGDGNLWFTEAGFSTVGRITPSGLVTEFPAPATNPQRIAAGPDGNLWFTAGAPYTKVVRITPSGTVQEFSAGISGRADGIAAGPDGNMWFTENLANKVARITTGQPEARPAISGAPEVGESLTCSDGTWSSALRSVARQWLRDGVAIPGATGASYTPVAADRGRSVTCRVLATVAGVLVPVSAVSDAVVIADPFGALSASTLSFGSVTVGQTSAAQSLTISNPGQSVLRLSGLAFNGPDFVLIDPFGCATAALSPGASCTVQVAFKPSKIGSASVLLSVGSNSSGTPSVTLSGIGSAGADVPISAKVVDVPVGPGDAASIKAAVTIAPGRTIVSYLWSIDGPDPNSATIETGSLDTLLLRVGRKDATLWVWAVDDLGNISDTPARVVVDVPEDSCAPGTTSGDLRLGWLHIKSTACIKRRSGGADYVVPIKGGGASINGLEVSCPSSGTCGALEIRNTDGNGQLPPGSSRPFTLKSTSKMRLKWPNGQEGTVDLGEQTLSFESPAGLKPTANRDTPQATAARDQNLSAPPQPLPPPPIATPRKEILFGTHTIPASTKIGTLSTSGTVSLSVFGPTGPANEPGMKLHTDVKVAVPGTAQPSSAPLDQEANAETGPETESGEWEVHVGGLPVAPLFHLEDLSLRYMPLVKAGKDGWKTDRQKVFNFKAVIGIDITGWTVAAEGGFDGGNGRFGSFEWIGFGFYRNDGQSVLPGFERKINLNKNRITKALNQPSPLVPVELQSLAGRFQVVPYLSISGGLEVIMRPVSGSDKILGARFSYDQQHEDEGVLKPNALSFGVTFPLGGALDGVTILGDVLIDWRTDKVNGKAVTSGGFGMSGRAYYTKEIKIAGRTVKLLFFQGGIYFFGGNTLVRPKDCPAIDRCGVLQPYGEFGMYAAVSILSWEIARARILFNQNVVAGCGALGLLKGWFVHKWADKDVLTGFGSCENITSYSVVPQFSGFYRRRGQTAAAAPVVRLKVPAGVAAANLSLTSIDGLARVRVDGPGGFSYTTPATVGIHGKPSDPAYAAMDEVQHRTVIGIPHPKPGVYRISTIADAARIVNAEVAYSRPTTVKAKLSGSGARRTLSYTVNGPAGANVVFDERGGGSAAQTIGMAKGSRGKIRFRSGDLQGRKRTIVAKVTTSDGTNLPDQTVARYTAPALVPAKPRGLRIAVDRNRARATVTWAGVQDAVGYRVRLTTSAGRRLNQYVRGTRLTVPSVYPGQRITVTVLGVSRFLSAGAPSTATVTIPHPKATKRKKHKK